MSGVNTAPARLPAGKAPVGSGSAPLIAQLLGLALVGLGVLGVQAAVSTVQGGTSWLTSAADSVDGTRHDAAIVLVVAVVAVLLGLLLLPIVLRRRPRTSVPLSAATGVHLRLDGLAQIARAALDGVDTLTDARVSASARTVRVNAVSFAPVAEHARIVEETQRALVEAYAALERPPRIVVRLKHDGLDTTQEA